jgi:uncharacterized protein (TIGR03032 family)
MNERNSDSKAPAFELLASPHFSTWLAEQRASLAFTTYQAGKLFFLGLQPNGRLEVFNRTFNRAMGLHASPDSLYLGTLYQLWRFENSLAPGERYNGYDRVYVPQVAYTTGDVDMHDIGVDGHGRVVFVNTLFGCLATVSERYSFAPLWQPPFLSRLAAEDRCHLNGVAFEDGVARYVTSVSQSDVADGWRDQRADGGVVIDVETSSVMLAGLSMPHSPRIHRGQLWVLDSGTGQLFCPGYARGLAFIGDYAIIGLSKARQNRTFTGLALDEALDARRAEARCGLLIVDLRSGDAVHWVRLEGVVEELYDVAVIPGVVRPMAIGTQSDEIRRVIRVGPASASPPSDTRGSGA